MPMRIGILSLLALATAHAAAPTGPWGAGRVPSLRKAVAAPASNLGTPLSRVSVSLRPVSFRCRGRASSPLSRCALEICVRMHPDAMTLCLKV